MSTIGYATVSVIPSAKGFGKTLSTQIDPELSQAGESGGSKVTSALGNILKKGSLAVGVAAGGILGTALFKGFERLSAIDQAKAKLAGLGNSAATVSTIMDNALASVKGTAFGLGDAATVAAGAVASGIKPGKDLTANLKLVADAATIAGVPLNDMGAIFNKVAASGKLQGDVIAQLGDQGIPILQLLAKQLHTTPAEVAKLASQGKIDFATFSEAMQSGLGGAALKSGDTFQGALANMGAALGRLGAGLLSGLFPIAKQVFGDLTTFLDGITAKVTPVADAFAAKLPGAFKAVGDALKSLTAGGGGPLKPLIDAFKDFITNVGSAATKVGPALLTIVKGLEPIAKLAVGAAIVGLTVAFAALGPVINGLATAFAGITDFVSSNQTGFKILAGIIGAILLPVMIQTTVAAVAQGVELLLTNAAWLAYGVVTFAMSTTLKIVTAAQWLLNAAMSANPIALVVIAIAALAAGIIYAYTHFSVFHDVVNTVFSFLQNIVTTVLDFITAHWPLLLAILTGPIGLATLFIIDHWEQIKTGTTNAFNAVVTFLTGIPGTIRDALASMVGFVEKVAADAWEKFSTKTHDLVADIITFVKGIPGKARDALADLAGTLGTKAKEALDEFISREKTGITNIIQAFKDLPGKIKSGLGDLTGFLKGKGEDIVRGLISGIGALKDDVIQALLDLIPGPLKKFAGKLGINSPSTVFAGFGMNIGQGLIVGINSQQAPVAKAAAALANVAMNAHNNALNGGLGAAPLVASARTSLSAPRIDASTIGSVAPGQIAGGATHDDVVAAIERLIAATEGDQRRRLQADRAAGSR